MKSNVTLYAILLLFFTTSCTDEMLEEDPKGQISEDFLATEDGLNNLVLSQYSQNRWIVEDLGHYLAFFPSDLFTYSVNGNDAIQLTSGNTGLMPSLGSISTHWRNLYSGINNMNFGLNALQENEINNSDVLVGELSFLRAWYYLLVVETWGEGAHYTTESTSTVVTEGNQTTIDVFYSLILDDIDRAIVTLPESAMETGRLTKPAAKAMKGRILLALAGYSDEIVQNAGIESRNALYSTARTLAEDVMSSSFRLLDDYASIFDVYNEDNDEIIWSVQFTDQHQFNTGPIDSGGHGLHRYWIGNYNRSARTQEVLPRMYGHSIYYGREYRHNMMTRYFVTLFDKEDERLDGTIQTVWYALWNESTQQEDAEGVPLKDGVQTDTILYKPLFNVDDATAQAYASRGIAIDGLNHIYQEDGTPRNAARSWHHSMTKYLDPSREVPKEEGSHKDVVILRLGEQYLIAAESAFYLGDPAAAAGYLNELRERARLDSEALPVNPSDIDIDFILDERARELGGELFRWFDLKRTHKLVERINKFNPDAQGIQEFHRVRPVPQSELDRVTNRGEFIQNPGYN